MRKIYLIAGHNGPGTGATGHIDEGAETIKLQSLVASIMEQYGFRPETEPDTSSKLSAVVSWLKSKVGKSDICVDIHFNASSNPMATGVECLYSTDGDIERSMARDLCCVLSSTMGIRNRGAKPESAGAHSKLAMLSSFSCEQLILEVCFVTNQDDAKRYHEKRELVARDIAMVLMRYACE